MFGPTGCLTETAVAAAGDGGTPAAWGIFPRVALRASAIEVYNEVAYDLLSTSGAPLQVTKDELSTMH